MANSPQAIKRARQNKRRYEHNKSLRSKMRTFLKNTLKSVAGGDKAKAGEEAKKALQYLDRMAGNKQIHANKAARLKSRLNAKVKAMK